MIASFVLPALFLGSGLLALVVLVLAWATYGGELRAIRRQLAGLEEHRAFNVQLALTETREFTSAPRRSVKPKAERRPRSRPALRVAA